MFIHLSLHKSTAVVGIPSPKMKNEFTLCCQILAKCWYGGHLWIRLAMDCEIMVEKGINFILCLGTAYDVSSMGSIGNSRSFLLIGKACLSKQLLSLNLSFEL